MSGSVYDEIARESVTEPPSDSCRARVNEAAMQSKDAITRERGVFDRIRIWDRDEVTGELTAHLPAAQ